MTVGERIQFHRKKQNLSQEELGQKLNISRQTVSLWEKDQTLPTVDNLLLLKDIFGITMDELLGVEARSEDAPAPLEVHTFTYKEEPIKRMYKSQTSILTLLLVFLLALTVAAWLGMGEWNNGILVGSLLMGDLAMALILWNNLKERGHTLRTLADRTVTVSMFDSDLVLETVRAGEKPSQVCIPYHEITNVVADVSFYQLHFGGKMYLLPMELFQKGELDPDSRLEILLKNNLAKNKRTPVKGLWRLVSFGLVYLCIVAPFLCVLAAACLDIEMLLEGSEAFIMEFYWLFFAALAIPFASIAVGVYLRGKKKKATKNIVAGVLCALALFGMGTAESMDAYTAEELAWDNFSWVEYVMGFDLPETELMINTLYEETFIEEEKLYLYTSVCIAVIAPEERETFASTLTEEAKWHTDLSEELKAVLPFEDDYDYILLWDPYTDEYNCLPTEEGFHQLTCLIYDRETGILTMWEFPWENVPTEE